MFTSKFESLYQFEIPSWFRNAKFGIWSHWGPQSVPMFGDWYARNMYIQGTPQYLYHLRHYGHPSEFGWKDVCKLWRAEKFDPEGLMDLYYKAGARYFMAQAMHHDNFFNYDSKINPHNSINIGPQKDICKLWHNAAKKHNLPFGLSEHLGASFSWWKGNKYADTYGPYKDIPYDGNDPKYRDFYHDNYEHKKGAVADLDLWYTKNTAFKKYWLDTVTELINKFQPELLYSDGVLPFGTHWGHWLEEEAAMPGDACYAEGLEAVAHLYNTSINKNGTNQSIYLQKDRRPEIYRVGILDIEKSQLSDTSTDPWHTDTCIGNWFYDVRQEYKKPDQLIEMLIDIISKNGSMLLNILQRPDGTLDAEALYILQELTHWFSICSEGVYETRPWKVSAEGDTRVLIEGFTEQKTNWNSSDTRFVCNGKKVYAFLLAPPANRVAILKSFIDEKVESVSLLGHGKLEFSQNFGMLNVKLPKELPTKYANCLAINIA